MDNAIKASNLTKCYGRFLAVAPVSFEVSNKKAYSSEFKKGGAGEGIPAPFYQ